MYIGYLDIDTVVYGDLKTVCHISLDIRTENNSPKAKFEGAISEARKITHEVIISDRIVTVPFFGPELNVNFNYRIDLINGFKDFYKKLLKEIGGSKNLEIIATGMTHKELDELIKE